MGQRGKGGREREKKFTWWVVCGCVCLYVCAYRCGVQRISYCFFTLFMSLCVCVQFCSCKACCTRLCHDIPRYSTIAFTIIILFIFYYYYY